jgi:enoyl-CoA hydratase
VRVFIIRGAGGAFAAGTDIAQFTGFDGDAGVAYEQRIEAVIDRIERLPMITIAEVDGPAVGAGCFIAMACDLRLCSPRAQFGAPVSRTLGNCLSITSTARVVDLVGVALTKDMMLTGRLVDADEARRLGLATQLLPQDGLSDAVMKVAADLSTRARSTVVGTKAMLQRLRDHRRPGAASADDVLREVYGSADFKEGVAAFLAGRKPEWVKRGPRT